LIPGVRIWLRRLLLALLLLAGLYLLGANLFLNTPLGPRTLNRHPERFRISWSSAWSVWPGLVQVRGLRLRGHVHEVTWSVTAARARGGIDLPLLLRRTFRVADLHVEEARSWVRRGLDEQTPEDRRQDREDKGGREEPNPHPWTLFFERVGLDHLREFDFNDVHLTGDGRVEGAFEVVLGQSFRLAPTRVRMPAARLALGNDPIAQEVDLAARVSLGPYVPHDHPGLEGFDFLTGTLQARGRVPDLPFLEHTRIVETGHRVPGRLAADLRFEQGRLTPGSRFDLTAPAAGPASPFALTTTVTGGGGGALLHLGVEAKGFTAGRGPGRPPVFRAATLSVASTSPETRLSRIFATARDVRDVRKPPITLPLESDVRASGVQIEAGSGATMRVTFDRAAGRIDLAGLLSRRIDFNGLRADGVSARMVLAKAPVTRKDRNSSWAVRIAGLRLSQIREIALGDDLLAGDAQADAAFSYRPDGTLAIQRLALTMPAGRFQIGGETVAQALSVRLDARLDPSVLGQTSGLAVLRSVSGTAGLRARISSLGFLQPYLRKIPWLTLEGRGLLSGDVRLDHGRLAPGSRLAVEASPVQAKIFDSLATGRGGVHVEVNGGSNKSQATPVTSLRVHLDRFVLEALRQPGRPDYIRGQGLRIAAATPGALDLTAPMPDFDATLDLPDAEVPDLTVYNALLPAEAGFSILSGNGRARLHLEASTATNRTRGAATLTSDAARVRFQNLELTGRLALDAPLVSPDFLSRRFDLKGTRLELNGVSYRNVEAKDETETPGWWARAALSGGSIAWGAPLALRGEGNIDMKNPGPLLALFAERSRFLRWFNDALNVENITARGVVRIGGGKVQIESLQATGGPLELRSRMIFSKVQRSGDLYLRYGRLAAGIELRGGKRSFKLRRPLDWYQGRQGL
jgi:hypothetical protein